MGKPTVKQIAALNYINQGMSKRQAMIRAGYSVSTARYPKGNLMVSNGAKQTMESLKEELINKGLTVEYMAGKIKEWIDAKKIITSHTGPDFEFPDWEVQIKGFKEYGKIMGFDSSQDEIAKVKRKMTITEFVEGTEPSFKDEV